MSLIATYLQDIRVNYPSNLDRDELRVTQTGLLTAVLEMTNSQMSIVSQDLKAKAEISEGRNLDVPVRKKGAVTILTARSCTIGGGQSDSALVRVVWKTVVADVLMVPSQYEKNQIGYLADFNQKLREIAEAFKVEIENDLDTAMDTNKSQVYNSSIVTTKYTLAGSAIQVLPTQVDFFFNDLESINYSDDFYVSPIKVIASPTIMPTVMKYINQGTGNAVNTQFQFAGKDFTFSNRVTNGVGKLGTGYFMADGSVGLLTRVATDSRLRHKSTSGVEWREDTIPTMPFTVGIQYKSECSDQSALEASGLAHLKATLAEHYQISFDYAIIVPYNTDLATKPSVIRKFEFIPAP
jgi:hypothetical protein